MNLSFRMLRAAPAAFSQFISTVWIWWLTRACWLAQPKPPPWIVASPKSQRKVLSLLCSIFAREWDCNAQVMQGILSGGHQCHHLSSRKYRTPYEDTLSDYFHCHCHKNQKDALERVTGWRGTCNLQGVGRRTNVLKHESEWLSLYYTLTFENCHIL